MKQIELPGRYFNPEEIVRFTEDLKEHFSPVRVRFFKAEFRSEEAVKPTHVFRADPIKANYAVVNLNSRTAIEFFKRSNVKGHVYDENLGEEEVRAIQNVLLKNRMQNIPAPKIKVMPTLSVAAQPPSIFSKIFEVFEKFLSALKSR